MMRFVAEPPRRWGFQSICIGFDLPQVISGQSQTQRMSAKSKFLGQIRFATTEKHYIGAQSRWQGARLQTRFGPHDVSPPAVCGAGGPYRSGAGDRNN